MRGWSELVTRIRALLDRRRMEAELDEELAFHLERETEKLVASGLPPDEARRLARVRFGGVERHRERTREAWGVRRVQELAQDLRLALRRMRSSPLFTGLAVGILALGVGGSVAVFSVTHGLLLRPLPFDDADRLRVFWSDYNWRGIEYDHVRGLVDGLDIGAYTVDGTSLRRDGRSRHLLTTLGSAELLDLLGTPPLLGRTFQPGEDRPGAEPVVVLSHALWSEAFGGDSTVVGSSVVLDGRSTRVVGVMPPDFYFPTPEVQAWRPLNLDPADPAYEGNGWLVLIGRLDPSFGSEEIEGGVATITRALGDRFTYAEAWDKTRDAHLTPLRAYLFGEVRTVVLLLSGAVALLLLMAVGNVASLLLARTVDRGDEIGLRRALGAGRGRLLRQLTTETALLALLATAGAAFCARLAFSALVGALPLGDGFPGTLTLRTDVLVGAVAIMVALAVGAALLPSLRRMWSPLERPESSRGGAGSSRRTAGLQSALVGVQVTTAVLLLSGAILFARSAERIQGVDLGVESDGVVALDVSLDGSAMGAEERTTVFRDLLREVQALPGVRSAGYNVRLPIRDDGVQGTTRIEDRPEWVGPRAPNSYWRAITPGYFETMGLTVERGRGFTAADRAGALDVGVVNRAFAGQMWPGEEPVGRRLQGTFDSNWVTVVGVVEDVRLRGPRRDAPPILYRPDAQWRDPWSYRVLVARGDGEASRLLPLVRERVEAYHPAVTGLRGTTLRDVVDRSMGDTLRLRFYFSLLAALALAIGSGGIYGVVSYAVSRRWSEYGVRQALGASGSRVVREVCRQALAPVIAGAIAGLLISFFAVRLTAGLLFSIAPRDPLSLLGGAALLVAVGAVAALVPALRASRVSPVRALRVE